MELLTFAFLLSTAAASVPSFLMHGYSVIILPSEHSRNPGDSKVFAANFFSYGTDSGYLSFGWWLPADLSTNHTCCVPRPESYDWFEYSTGNCTAKGCHIHCVNHPTLDPDTAFLDDDYILRFLNIGPGDDEGQINVGYFDKENGGYAVGKRKLLSVPDADQATAQDCNEAFLTIQELQNQRQLPIQFDLENPCAQHKHAAQVALSGI